MGQEYAKCGSQSARDDFVRQHATRWCELARLPYFDVCRMIVIDPMHNLLLGMCFTLILLSVVINVCVGLVKTHFYHIWVKLKVLRKTKEIRHLHAVLADVSRLAQMPTPLLLMWFVARDSYVSGAVAFPDGRACRRIPDG